MIIRKYLVDDINEALFKIKHELGDDAYIINQKQVRQPGVKGLFSNKKLEVTVGLANKPDSHKENKSPEKQTSNDIQQLSPQIGSNNLDTSNLEVSNNQYGRDYSQVAPKPMAYSREFNKPIAYEQEITKPISYDQEITKPTTYTQEISRPMAPPQEPSKSISYYNKLFEEKQKVLNNFGEEIFGGRDGRALDNRRKPPFSNNFNTVSTKGFETYKNNREPSQEAVDLNTELNYKTVGFNNQLASDARRERVHNETSIREVNVDKSILENIQNDIHEIKNTMQDFINNKPHDSYLDEILYRQDICKELCDEIRINCTLTKDELMDKRVVKKYLREVFSEIIKIDDQGISNKVVVVGPTGSGKTTTIAKLAGMLCFNLNKKVGLVTIDTFRVGAVEQLRMYGEVMNIPYKHVTTLNDMRNVFDDMRSCEVVLVDTIGRSSKNVIHLSELNMFIQSIQSENVTLVLSAGMNKQDITGFIDSFKGINFKNVIITKLDETNSFGMFVNVCYKTSLPISFVTVGQDVPLDIKKADKEEILDMILGE